MVFLSNIHDDLSGKQKKLKEKIVVERVGERLKEMAQLEQPFIEDCSISVDEYVRQVAGKIRENMKIRRFITDTLVMKLRFKRLALRNKIRQ